VAACLYRLAAFSARQAEGRYSSQVYPREISAYGRTCGGWLHHSLPYGEGVDWLQYVFAAGTAAIKAKDVAYIVVEPQVIEVEAAFPLFPSRMRGTWHLLGIERFLKVRRLSEEAVTEDQRPAEIEKVETPSL
jgi:hypothetical protein